MTPYYETELGKLYHGCCVEIMPELEHVDVVLADPQYNYGIKYLHSNDSLTDDEYSCYINSWWNVLPTQKRIVFIGTGNQRFWYRFNPTATACWYKPGNPSSGNPFQWNEWEPVLVWGVSFRLSDVFKCPISKQKDIGIHPCPKPLKLIVDIVGRIRTKGVILDPFLGSGTTAVACERLKRKWISIEIEEKYCEISAKRIELERKQLKLF